jgi:hypothetical protein
MVVETRAPKARFELQPGDSCAVRAKRAHRVSGKNGGRCRFAILQGGGRYDFNPVGGANPVDAATAHADGLKRP